MKNFYHINVLLLALLCINVTYVMESSGSIELEEEPEQKEKLVKVQLKYGIFCAESAVLKKLVGVADNDINSSVHRRRSYPVEGSYSFEQYQANFPNHLPDTFCLPISRNFMEKIYKNADAICTYGLYGGEERYKELSRNLGLSHFSGREIESLKETIMPLGSSALNNLLERNIVEIKDVKSRADCMVMGCCFGLLFLLMKMIELDEKS